MNLCIETFIVAAVGIAGVAGSIISTIITNNYNLAKDQKAREAVMLQDKLNSSGRTRKVSRGAIEVC